jgi:hypothetical protein
MMNKIKNNNLINKLDCIILEAKLIAKTITGCTIQDTELIQYNTTEWIMFCNLNKFYDTSKGLYVPRAKRAYVIKDDEFAIPNTLHEYYGHGLIIEHSGIGKKLLTARNIADYMFNKEECTQGVCDTNWANYEGFAVWLEEKLCVELNQEKLFNKKLGFLNKQYREAHEQVKNAEKQLTTNGLVKMMGFPSRYV